MPIANPNFSKVKATPKKRINELESLRGILALWVVVSHILPSAGITDQALGKFKFLAEGEYAVQIFIIMSGFFIFFLLDAAREPYGKFIIRRFLRLFPAYFVCLVISLLMLNPSIEILSNLDWQHPQNLFRIEVIQDSLNYFLPQLVAHLTMLHGAIPDSVLPNSQYAIIGQAWSISLEWQFYLVAPLFFYAIDKKNPLTITLLLAISCLWYYSSQSLPQGFLFTQIPFFLLGILSFYFWKNYHNLIVLSQQQWALLMPIAVVVTLLFTSEIATTLWVLVFFSIIALGENNDLIVEKIVCRVLNNKIMLYLGKISYSIYLAHIIVLYGVMYGLERLLPESSQLFYLIMLLTLVPGLTIFISHLLYDLIEKPFIKLGKRLFVS
jgi:peptidoglycan/LPS O-acetylase OafA/YrhL